MANQKEYNLQPCLICGKIPEIEKDCGTQIEIQCCVVFMSVQKSDYLTLEQRDTWDDNKLKYPDELEMYGLQVIIDDWNSVMNKNEVLRIEHLKEMGCIDE